MQKDAALTSYCDETDRLQDRSECFLLSIRLHEICSFFPPYHLETLGSRSSNVSDSSFIGSVSSARDDYFQSSLIRSVP